MKRKNYRQTDEKMKRRLKSLGLAIVDLRKQQGLSQTELAQKANISPSYLSRIERNNSASPCAVSFGILYDITVALGIDIADFLGYAQNFEDEDTAAKI